MHEDRRMAYWFSSLCRRTAALEIAAGWRVPLAKLDLMTGAEPSVPRKFRIAFTNRRAARVTLCDAFRVARRERADGPRDACGGGCPSPPAPRVWMAGGVMPVAFSGGLGLWLICSTISDCLWRRERLRSDTIVGSISDVLALAPRKKKRCFVASNIAVARQPVALT
jgi:hypothetical protein